MQQNWTFSKLRLYGSLAALALLGTSTPFIMPFLVGFIGPFVLIIFAFIMIAIGYIGVAETIHRDRVFTLVMEEYRMGTLSFIPSTEEALKIHSAAQRNCLTVHEYVKYMRELESATTHPLSKDFLLNGY